MYISFYSFVILFFSYVIIVVREVYPLDNCQFVGIHRLERIFICKLIVQYLFDDVSYADDVAFNHVVQLTEK